MASFHPKRIFGRLIHKFRAIKWNTIFFCTFPFVVNPRIFEYFDLAIQGINLAIWPLMAKIFLNDSVCRIMSLPNSHLLCGERGGGKGRSTGLCEAEPKNIMARQKMIYSVYGSGTVASSSVLDCHAYTDFDLEINPF